jgi:hypothetical protein
VVSALLLALLASVLPFTPASAQLEENLSSFSDDTAEGYLKPLAEAFGQNLNTGFFTSAYIPPRGFSVRLSVYGMSVLFDDEDDMFLATTGGDFSPEQEVETSTVVGPGESTSVSGDGGTTFVFPGGFDLRSFTLAVPQLTIGSFAGTEAMIRWIGVDTGDAELGDIDLFGLGLRHSVSQHMGAPPVDLAVYAFWQSFKVGDDDLVDATTFSFGVQGSKRFGILEPFASLGLDSFDMSSTYTTNAGAADEETITVDFENQTSIHAVLGAGLHLGIVHLHVAGELAQRPGFSGGIGFGL